MHARDAPSGAGVLPTSRRTVRPRRSLYNATNLSMSLTANPEWLNPVII